MKLSNHQVLINCVKSLIKKYTPRKDNKCISKTRMKKCSLCRVYNIDMTENSIPSEKVNCSICPLFILHGSYGCTSFRTWHYIREREPETWKPRREFWEAVLLYLQCGDPRKYSPKKITRKTFEFMLLFEERIIKKYKL